MIIKTFRVPPIDNNDYLVIDEKTKTAALIDCSSIEIWDYVPNVEGIVKASSLGGNRGESEDIKLEYILLTHGHFDHVAGLRETSAKVCMHKNDIGWLNNVNQFMPMFGMPDITVPTIDCFVNDGDIIKLGETEIRVIYTPGHTQGGVCYLAEDNLFSGDTIFRESVGRCDLEGGNFEQIVESIKTKIFTLPDNTKIYPGHGKPSDVGWEKVHNNFM